VAPPSALPEQLPIPTPEVGVPEATPPPVEENQPDSPVPTPTPDPNTYVPPAAAIVAIVDNNPLNQVDTENGVRAVRAPLGATITFDATTSIPGSEPIQSYYWQFGGGLTDSTQSKEGIQYNEPGTYEVILVVQDAGNQTNRTTLLVTVEAGMP
jgi:hypothetical protein